MIRSMTGYGRGEAPLEDRKIIAEIRSVNHRFCDISVKLPKRFLLFEAEIKKLVNSFLSRGKIDVTVQFEGNGEETFNLAVNLPLAKTLYELLDTLKKELALRDEISLSSLLSFKDIIAAARETPETSNDWEALKPCLEQALEALRGMQEIEGGEIAHDLRERLSSIKTVIEEIEQVFPRALAERQTALRERIQKLCEEIELDASRMTQEVAIIADKSDITEELIRAKSHLKQFDQWLESTEPVGRKLDFILQEINREINTIGSKASDARISLNVVLVKNELEKIREQVQNIL